MVADACSKIERRHEQITASRHPVVLPGVVTTLPMSRDVSGDAVCYSDTHMNTPEPTMAAVDASAVGLTVSLGVLLVGLCSHPLGRRR